jgi:hypothetical protein
VRKLLVGLGVFACLGGFGAHARPLVQAAQTAEKSAEPSSGPHLFYQEKSRRTSPTGDFITYVLRADGLPQGKPYSLTGTWMNGRTAKVREPLHLDGSGRVLTKDGSEFDLVLGGTFTGEFIRFTLISDDGTAKASAEITPVPIQAVGKGGCRLTVKPMTVTGEAFSIIGEGFQPGQEIKTLANSSGKVMEGHADNKGGNLKMVIFPAMAGQSGGNASLTASDKSCSVTVRYAWGSAMMKLSPTANQETPETQATAPGHPAPTQAPADARPEAVATPQLSKGGELVRLAMHAVNLDHNIAVINVFLPHVTGAIYMGKEKITHENAKDVLERFQRERRELNVQMDREGLTDIAGEYDWSKGEQAECKLKDLPSDAPGPVTVVQNQHDVEFKGKGPEGCGVVVGTVVVLQTGKCGGVSSGRLVANAWSDHSIKMLLVDTDSGVRCDAGTLRKRSTQQ